MKSLVYCSLCLLVSAVFASAAPQEYGAILDYLEQHHPSGTPIIAAVKDAGGQRLVFTQSGEKPARGQELLVLEETKGKPPPLFPLKAVIKVDSIINETIIASVVEEISGPVKAEDPIAYPVSPRIYLSTNIAQKQDCSVYSGVLEALLAENYDVIELPGSASIPDTQDYGLHMHLYKSQNHLTAKIQSIYTRSTLFSKTYSIARQFRSQASKEKSLTTPRPSGPETPEPPAAAETRGEEKEQAFAAAAQAPRQDGKIRLPGAFRRIVAAELDGKPPRELVLLSKNAVSAFTVEAHALRKLDAHTFRSSDIIGLHLHAMDLNQDGTEEIFATCGKKIEYLQAGDTAIRSLALDWKKGRFVVLAADIPFYLRVTNRPEGGEVLLGQKKNGPEQYDGPIFRVHWDPESQGLSAGPDYKPAAGIYCLYQFLFASGAREKVLILEPANHVSLYKMPEERLLDATDVHFGKYHEIPYPIRLAEKQYRGGFDEEISSKDVYAVRRLLRKPEFQDQCFLIQKGRTTDGIQDRVLSFINRKTGRDRIVALQSRADTLYRSWTSKAVPRDLIDFAFFAQNGKTRLLALERDSQGYALEVMSAQQ